MEGKGRKVWKNGVEQKAAVFFKMKIGEPAYRQFPDFVVKQEQNPVRI